MKRVYQGGAFLLFFASASTMAATTLGLGAMVSSSPYDYKDKTTYSPFPVLSYDNDYFYIDSYELGINLFKNETQHLALIGLYDTHEFSPKDAVKSLSKVSKRKASLYAGLRYNAATIVGNFNTAITHDTLGNSKGLKIDSAWSYPWTIGAWSLIPEVGVEWNNKKQNDYYYGVDRDESLKSGVAEYRSNSSFTPYTNITMAYSFNENWTGAVFAGTQFLPGEQRNSPLASGKKVLYSAGAAVSYTF